MILEPYLDETRTVGNNEFSISADGLELTGTTGDDTTWTIVLTNELFLRAAIGGERYYFEAEIIEQGTKEIAVGFQRFIPSSSQPFIGGSSAGVGYYSTPTVGRVYNGSTVPNFPAYSNGDIIGVLIHVGLTLSLIHI